MEFRNMTLNDGLLRLYWVWSDALAVLYALWSLMDVRVGIVDAHAVSAGVLPHDAHHGVISLATRPVALPFEEYLLPGHRYNAGLHHAVHGILVRFERCAA